MVVPAGQSREVYALLAARLRQALPSLATDINAAVGEEVSEYSRPIEGLFGRNLTMGVERALSAFVDLLDEPAQPTLPRNFYLELGRGELRQGRGLDALLSAYRVGARVAWRTVGDLAVDAGAPPAVLVKLAELLFTYIDGLSALSVRGYAEEQAARAGERDRRRAELARLLITGIDEETLRELAVLARWPLPEHLVAVILPPHSAEVALPSDALIWPRDDDVVALVPCTADFGLAQLRQRLKGVPAVVGSLVQPREVRQSLAAAEALALIEVTGDRRHAEPILVDDHLLDLVLRADPALLDRLSRQLLAPLGAVPESARERLAVTLLAWLAHAGARNAVAQALHVHPQTVRYRMTQLREAFGAALDDPESRTALIVVLRAAYGPVPGAGRAERSAEA
ncbi:MAG TPA: helix-turn-helix domain-containing protein [Frankiaceae bacterium]|nr:helix-turn-helix domain-containing protein [Frankiaceae bacterium]